MKVNVENEKLVSQDLANELFSLDSNTGILEWKVYKASNKVKPGDIAGCKHSSGYIVVGINGIDYKAHRLIWLIVHGKWPKTKLDHKDHIRHHNWIDNLREVTNKENNCNASKRKDNTSGFTGVNWKKQFNKWQASISVDNKQKHLGYFTNKEDAISARKRANIEYGYHENHGKQLKVAA